MPKNITSAKSAGFCYGVKKAVDTAKKLKIDNPDKKIYILGALIHNTLVTDELEELGIFTVDELPADSNNAICIIRSHGETPERIEQIKNAGFEVVDLTCPDVKKVQQKAINLADKGYFVVIIGKENHPEVVAIRANALLHSENVVVVNTVEEIQTNRDMLKAHKRIGVVIQTTQTISHVQEIISALVPLARELKIENTICPSTSNRQKETLALAKNSDLVVVVGSKTSANTTHLAQICEPLTRTIHIETAEELEIYKDLIEKAENISVTAGASTPQNLIEKVINKLEKGE
ncbi:MAG: 4-hydroxy-3-methylbut-2-enyl diphosphate reductase [Fusobacterium sp.]|nr:4-hydroxy-3-methylbut-2-enyl diphosphate reductase [Fusobacterium sp.]